MILSGQDKFEKRQLNCRTALHARRGPLYGNRNIAFLLEKSYRGYDGMLKRDMLYTRFGAREVVSEARAVFIGQVGTLEVRSHPGFGPAMGGPANFEDILKAKGIQPAPGVQKRPLILSGRAHEVTLLQCDPDLVIFRISALPPAVFGGAGKGRKRYRISGKSLIKTWMQTLLQEWIGKSGQLQLDSRPLIPAKVDSIEWMASRRISQIDMDCSGEDAPDAFRWLETGLSKSARHADLSDSEITGILSGFGIVLPPQAQLQGKTQSELSKGSSCLSIRYAHLLPDPDPSPDGHTAQVPPHMNNGFIVMENDYWEILIDAGTGKVFGESRKWRTEPNPGHRKHESVITDQDSAH